MEQINLTATRRDGIGKGPAGRLRAAGQVPAILYGASVKGAVPLTFSAKEIDRVLHTAAGGNVLVNLKLEGEGNKMVMFKEIERHPLRGTIQHVDLLEVRMDHKITVEVPVHLTGKAEGLAFGGIVQHEARRLKIECLPSNIPDSIDIDITPLGIGDAIHVKDIQLKEGLRAIDDKDLTVVSIVAPTAEVAPKTAEEVEAELAKSFEEKEKEKKEE